MLMNQADTNLRDAIAALRQENIEVVMELNGLRSDMGLREEQIAALKTTIRDLESSMAREREFNADNRRINADYLVNILRKFLMSTIPSERAKLVPVLCTILHLRPDETRVGFYFCEVVVCVGCLACLFCFVLFCFVCFVLLCCVVLAGFAFASAALLFCCLFSLSLLLPLSSACSGPITSNSFALLCRRSLRSGRCARAGSWAGCCHRR
jgi:hypothetical protein